MSDSDAKAVLATKVDESIVSAFEVLRKRIDEFGVTSPNIQRLGNSGRVLLELPGVKDVERATDLITTTACLERTRRRSIASERAWRTEEERERYIRWCRY